MSKKIYLDAPNVGALEKRYLSRAIDTNYVSTVGPYVSEFEDIFSRYLGVKKAASTQSGTASLHVALHELGIGKDDEVIVPALTFVATINPVLYVGATPVIADVDINTWNISPESIENNITKKTKAIIPVHLYGNPCDMDRIMAIAKKYNLFVIEDATESLGAKYKKVHTGTSGDIGCFSFNGNKVIATGGGGMVVGSDIERIKHIKFLVNQGRDESKEYYYPEIGFNYRMTNIEAALGIAQMKKLGTFLKKKKRFNEIYREELKGSDFISFQSEYANATSSSWLTCVVFKNGLNVSSLRDRLKDKGVPSRRIFMPVMELPPYRAYGRGGLKNSYDIYKRGLCLPSSTLNSEDDIYHVCKVLKGTLRKWQGNTCLS